MLTKLPLTPKHISHAKTTKPKFIKLNGFEVLPMGIDFIPTLRNFQAAITVSNLNMIVTMLYFIVKNAQGWHNILPTKCFIALYDHYGYIPLLPDQYEHSKHAITASFYGYKFRVLSIPDFLSVWFFPPPLLDTPPSLTEKEEVHRPLVRDGKTRRNHASVSSSPSWYPSLLQRPLSRNYIDQLKNKGTHDEWVRFYSTLFTHSGSDHSIFTTHPFFIPAYTSTRKVLLVPLSLVNDTKCITVDVNGFNYQILDREDFRWFYNIPRATACGFPDIPGGIRLTVDAMSAAASGVSATSIRFSTALTKLETLIEAVDDNQNQASVTNLINSSQTLVNEMISTSATLKQCFPPDEMQILRSQFAEIMAVITKFKVEESDVTNIISDAKFVVGGLKALYERYLVIPTPGKVVVGTISTIREAINIVLQYFRTHGLTDIVELLTDAWNKFLEKCPLLQDILARPMRTFLLLALGVAVGAFGFKMFQIVWNSVCNYVKLPFSLEEFRSFISPSPLSPESGESDDISAVGDHPSFAASLLSYITDISCSFDDAADALRKVGFSAMGVKGIGYFIELLSVNWIALDAYIAKLTLGYDPEEGFEPELQSAVNETMTILNKYSNFSTFGTLAQDTNMSLRVFKMLDRLKKGLQKIAGNNSALLKYRYRRLSALITDMNVLVKYLASRGITYESLKSRRPFVLGIQGESRVGKTYLASTLIERLLLHARNKMKIEFSSHKNDRNFNRTGNSEYWEGYRGQFAVSFDDFGSRADSVGNPNPCFHEFLSLASDEPVALNAAFESKGTLFATSPFVYATFNETPKPVSLTNPYAMVNRFDLWIRMSYRPSNCCPDDKCTCSKGALSKGCDCFCSRNFTSVAAQTGSGTTHYYLPKSTIPIADRYKCMVFHIQRVSHDMPLLRTKKQVKVGQELSLLQLLEVVEFGFEHRYKADRSQTESAADAYFGATSDDRCYLNSTPTNDIKLEDWKASSPLDLVSTIASDILNSKTALIALTATLSFLSGGLAHYLSTAHPSTFGSSAGAPEEYETRRMQRAYASRKRCQEKRLNALHKYEQQAEEAKHENLSSVGDESLVLPPELDPVTQSILLKAYNNGLSIYVDNKRLCGATGLFGGWAVVNTHNYLSSREKFDDGKTITLRNTRGGQLPMSFSKKTYPVTISDNPNTDLMVFDTGFTFSDITNLFWTHHAARSFVGSCANYAILPTADIDPAVMCLENVRNSKFPVKVKCPSFRSVPSTGTLHHYRTGSFTLDYALRSNGLFKPGDCGSVQCRADKNAPFVGIATATNGGIEAYSSVLVREAIEDVKAQLRLDKHIVPKLDDLMKTTTAIPDSANVICVGNIIGSIHTPNKTTLTPSSIALHPNCTLKAQKAPARLSAYKNKDGVYVQPRQNALNKVFDCKVELFSPSVKESIGLATDSYFGSLKDLGCHNFPSEPLSDAEVITMSKFDISSLNLSTSPGWPHCLQGDNTRKRNLIVNGDDAHFEVRLETFLKRWETEAAVMAPTVLPYVDYFKDELRQLLKVDRPRLFSSCSVYLTVLFRKWFGHFISWFRSKRLANGSAIGVNVYSSEWGELAGFIQKLSDGPDLLAGDFGNFDASISSETISAITDRIVDLFPEQTEKERNIRRCILYMMNRTYHIYSGRILQWYNGNPSGCPMTSELNTIVVNVVMRYSYHRTFGNLEDFHRLVYLIAYGDDHIISRHHSIRDTWTPEKIVSDLANLGMTLTDADKTGPPRPKALHEVEFLKRKFQTHKGWCECPLDFNTIQEMILWTKTTDRVAVEIERCENALYEAAYHSPERYALIQRHIGLLNPTSVFKIHPSLSQADARVAMRKRSGEMGFYY